MCRIGEELVTSLNFGSCHLLEALTTWEEQLSLTHGGMPSPPPPSPPSPSLPLHPSVRFFPSPALLCIYVFDTREMSLSLLKLLLAAQRAGFGPEPRLWV